MGALCAYAAMLLSDGGKDVTADNINTVCKAAGASVPAYYAQLFEKVAAMRPVDEMLPMQARSAAAVVAAVVAVALRRVVPHLLLLLRRNQAVMMPMLLLLAVVSSVRRVTIIRVANCHAGLASRTHV